MSLKAVHQELLEVIASSNAGDDEWLKNATNLSSRAFSLLELNSTNIKANWKSSKLQNEPSGAKTIAATLAQSIVSKYAETSQSQGSQVRNSEITTYEVNVPSFLPVFARLFSMRPDSVQMQTIFVKTVLLHFFDPILYSILCKELIHPVSSDGSSSKEYASTLPEWWPQLQESLVAKQIQMQNPMEYASHMDVNSPVQVYLLMKVFYSVSSQLQAIDARAANTTTAALNSILQLTLGSKAQKDAVILILSQRKEAVEQIYSSATLNGSGPMKKQSNLIMEVVCNRQTTVSVLATLHNLPGAQRMLSLFFQKQKPAFELVAKHPFKFILDLSDQLSESNDFKVATVLTYVFILSQKVSMLNCEPSHLAVYENFNRQSRVRSLFVVLSSFELAISKFTAQLIGDSSAGAILVHLEEEFGSSLPPFAKPNYFFIDENSSNSPLNSNAVGMASFIGDLNISTRLILQCINSTAQEEFEQIMNVTLDQKLREKVVSRNFEYFLALMLSILLTNSEIGESGSGTVEYKQIISLISVTIFETCRDYTAVLLVTLFNFVNDVCHLHTTAINSLIELLNIVINSNDLSEHQSLVDSAISLFEATFGTPVDGLPKSFKNVTVPKSEYAFLYNEGRIGKV